MKVRVIAVVVLELCACVSAASTGERQTVFRAQVEAVRLDVLVSHNRRPVAGLTASDFEVLDSGVPQKVQLTARTDTINLALVLDTSASVDGEQLQSLVAASRALLLALRPGDSVSLVTFAGGLSLRSAVGGEPSTIAAALSAVSGRGRTALWDGLFAGLAVVGGASGPALVILFTDGADNMSWLRQSQIVEAVRRSEAVVYAVVPRVDLLLLPGLEEVTAVSGGEVLSTDRRLVVARQFVDILAEFRARYLLMYEPAGVGRNDGWHRVSVKVKGKNATVRTRPGYYAMAPSGDRRRPRGDGRLP